MISIRVCVLFVGLLAYYSAMAAIPEEIVTVEIAKTKVSKKKSVHIQIHTMVSDTVEVSVKNFDKKIQSKNSYFIPQDSIVDIVLPLKELKMGIYFLDIKKDNNILVDAFTIMVSFLRYKFLKGQ
jgi:hypothetical protein